MRLDRRYPGQGLAEPPAIAARLWRRDRDARPARVVPSDTIVVRKEIKVKRPARLPNAGPNAPLLKRIVRYPYREHTARPRRVRVFEPVTVGHDREERVPAVQVVRDLRDPIFLGNPVRVLDRTRAPRILPTIDQWLAGRR